MKRMATNLKVLRFLNEEVMAEIVSEDDTTITLKNPVRIVVMPNKADPKNPSVGFAPYCDWTEDKDFVLNKSFLIYKAEPLTAFVNQYNSQFGGIVVPNSKLITP
jgi:hypothetical protein